MKIIVVVLCTTFGSNGAFAQDLTSCGEGYFIDLSVGYTPLGIGLELCGCSNQVKNCELVHIVMSQEANSQVVPLDCPSITLTERWWREGKDLVDIYDPITCEEYNESTTYTDRYEIPTGHLNGGDTLSILVCKTDPEDINLIEVSASPGPECEPIPCVPQMECPVEEKLYVGTDCAHLLPNFIEDIILYDTCFSPKVDVTEDFVIMQFPEPGTIVTSDLFVEITIANDEGMELATCDISVLVVEDRGPTFETMPIIEDIIVGEALPDLIELSAHDTTDQGILDIPVVSSIDPYDVDACGGYPITYRWLAIDHCENQTEIEVTFNVLPNSDGPRFATLPADIDTVFPGEMWPLLVDLVAVNPDGTTDGIDVVSSIDPYEEEICEGFPVTYRWVATDSCGTTNQISKTFFVAPHDDGPVFLEEPDPIDDIMQNDTLPDFQELQVVNAVGTSLGIEVVNYIDTTLFDPCSPYEITYTWTATDTCGYSSSVMTSFMVLPDTSLASVVVDLDNGDGQITIECQQTAAVTVPIDLEQHSDKIITIVITDDEWNILDEYLYEGPSDYEFNMGESHIIFTIADQCGNAFMDTINVLAADISAPIFICEEDQIVIIEDLSSCSVIANWIIPIAIDNCNEVSLTQTEGPEFGSEVGVGTYVIAYEAEDESGNKSECRFNYTVSPIGVSSLNCLPISLGLDSMCQATITKEAIIGRDLIICAPDFRVEIYASTDTLRGEEFDLSNYFGEAISYVICEPNTDICCENVILLTDSISPIISCLDTVTLSCISDLDNYFPDVVGECGVLTWEVENVAINPVCDTTNIQVEVTRSFVAIDASGNRSLSCIQLIQIEGVNLDTLVADSTLIFPPDTTISCDQFSLDSLSTINFGFPEIDSISIRDGSQPCGLTSFFIDDLFVENGCVKIIKRTWFVTEEICDFHYQEIRGVQTIKIIDSTGPSVSFPQGAITIYTSSHSCSGFLIDLPIEVSDNCQPKESITYQYEYDGQRFNPYDSIEIPFGIHQIRIILQDECRNTSIDSFYVDVQDNKRPVAACLDRTVVTVNEGPVYVSVGSIDIGSYDNCELQSVEIRKLEVTCSESDTTFSDKIEICCTEAGTTIEVLLRTIDHVGNENFCYSLIDVIDKIRPTITCPPNLVVNCGIDLNAGANPDDPYAGLFGGISTTDELPTFTFEEGILLDHDGPLTFGTASDNCVSGLEIKVTTKEEIDNCGQGFIYREFIAIDGHGNESYPCTQTIEIQGGENKDTLVLTWPKAEIVIDGCSSQEALEERDFGRPEIIGGACDLFGISYKDEFFDINEDGACAKLLRTWTLINWCDNDPLSSTQQFTQTVKIIDNESPIITRCSERPVLVFEASDNCNAVMVNLEKNAADGCTPISLIEWSVSIDYFSNQSIDKEVILLSDSTGVRLEEEMPVGTHIIKWKASDLCGNTTECVEELVVENAKAPSLIARGLTTSLHQEGAVEIWASDFDVKVEDNCGGGYDLAIGRAEEAFNPNQNVLTLTCADLGRSLVSIYAYKMLSDSTYNYSVVGVVVNVDDTNNVCENEIEEKEEITGIVYTSNGRSIPDVHLTLRRLRDKQMIREGGTDLNGLYTLGKINENIPYTVRPEKEGDHMNGLNTLDVLKIQRHLLGLAPFDSPYHIIAGDVNRDDRLTAADILEIRRMILQLPSRIFSMDPWRFIDSRILFYDKSQPFLDYLTDDIFIDRVVPSLDLVGVKLGDVDDSANIDYNENGKSRSIAKLMIPNIDFKRGERIEIPISAHSLESIYGIQMAFKIDPSLVIEDVLGPDIVFDISSDNTLYISRSEGHLFSAKETMTIVIKANRDGSLKDLISLDNTNLVGELYDEYLETKQLLLEFTEEERVGFNVVLGANPFIDKTVLEMSGSGLVHLQIVDIKGIVYHQESVLLEGQKTMIPLDRNVFGAPGIYYCRVEKDKEVKVYKLVLLY